MATGGALAALRTMVALRLAEISVVPSGLTARAAMEPCVRVSYAGFRIRTRFLAYWARCRRAISHSVLPENIGPTITSKRAVTASKSRSWAPAATPAPGPSTSEKAANMQKAISFAAVAKSSQSCLGPGLRVMSRPFGSIAPSQ